jgi:hypothetical protein
MWLRKRGTDQEYLQVILPWQKFERTLDERTELRFSILHIITAGGLDPELVFDLVADQVDAILVLKIWSDLVRAQGAPFPELERTQLPKMVDLARRGRLRLIPQSTPVQE